MKVSHSRHPRFAYIKRGAAPRAGRAGRSPFFLNSKEIFMQNAESADQESTKGNALRLVDIETFLELYKESLNPPPVESFNALFAKLGDKMVTRTIGRMKKVTDFLFDGREDLKKGKHGFAALFAPRYGEGMKPTPLAEATVRRFRDGLERCVDTRSFFQNTLAKTGDKREIVHLGAPQTLAYHLLAQAFSCNRNIYQRIVGDNVDVRVEIDASEALIRKLDAGGILNIVVGYGIEESRNSSRGQQLAIGFRPFDYWFGMVLLCHPARPLWTKVEGKKKPQNLNDEAYAAKVVKRQRDYQNLTTTDQASKHEPLYDQLHEVDPWEIDFAATPLIVVPSYGQARGVQRLISEWRPRGAVRVVPSFEEALALVRADQGVAISNGFYCTRKNISAFRMRPPQEFRRYLGVYYNRGGLSESALRVVRFLRDYLSVFERVIKVSGQSPAYGNVEYDKFCKTYASGVNTTFSEEWENVKAFLASSSRI
jgi:DNA-binding transcriptional LysR family regulator